MVFDNFKLGSQLNSNNVINQTSILENKKLYVISKYDPDIPQNIRIYDFAYSNLTDPEYTIDLFSNIELENCNFLHIEYNNDSDSIDLISHDASNLLSIHKNTFQSNLNSIDLGSIDFNNINSAKYIHEYMDAVHYNNNKYLIHVSGKYILEISNNTANSINNIDIYDYLDKSEINNILKVLILNNLYVIIVNKGIFIKVDLSFAKSSETFIINGYITIKDKFRKALYINQKIYLIPYDITILTVIDTNTNETENINLIYRRKKLLVYLKSQKFFATAIDYHEYIYMIPESYTQIFIFDTRTNTIVNIIDIVAYTNLFTTNKFVNAHLHNDKEYNKIFIIPNNFNQLAVINYDQQANSILNIEPDFNLIKTDIFKSIGSGIYITSSFDIGNQDNYTTIYIRGIIKLSLTSNPETSDIKEWRPNPNINIDTNDNIVALYNFENNTNNHSDLSDVLNLTGTGTFFYHNIDPKFNKTIYIDTTAILELEQVSSLNNYFTNNYFTIAFRSSNISTDGGTILYYGQNENNSIEIKYENNFQFALYINNTNLFEDNILGFDNFLLIKDTTNIKLYQNKVKKCDINLIDNSEITIENFTNFNIGNNFTGYFDNLYIINDIITENEINTLYNTGIYQKDIFRRLTSNTFFKDSNEKTIFNIYIPGSEENKYGSFNVNEFLTNNKINKVAINNIYSIKNNVIYFIPFNYKYLLELNLNTTVPELKLLDIRNNNDSFKTNFINFINFETGRFKSSIIIDNQLYLAPYFETESDNSFVPFLIYNFETGNTLDMFNIKLFNLSSEISGGSEENNFVRLFSTILFYKNTNNAKEYLFLIKENARFSIAYNIDEEKIQKIIYDTNANSNIGFIDGYINNTTTSNIIYLLDEHGSNIFVYNILYDNDDNISLSSNNIITTSNLDINEPMYSKMLEYDDTLYLIPFNANKILMYNISDPTDLTDPTESRKIGDYGINEELYKGGAIMKLNEIKYLIMVPYNAHRLYIYNIDDDIYTYIEEAIFKTNRFINCTIDMKGNIYMNTEFGDVLFYNLNLKIFFKQPRIPVLLKNKESISFKDLYEKFHSDYIYPKFNYNNRQVKLSDYFNKGGSRYYTNPKDTANIFINEDNDSIPIAQPTDVPTTYDDFIDLQIIQKDQEISLDSYRNARSQRYEYYDLYVENIDYKISAININNYNTYLYYIREYSDSINLITDKTAKGKDDISILDIEDFEINKNIPSKLEKLLININLGNVIQGVKRQNTLYLEEYSIIEIFIKNQRSFNSGTYLDINSSNFIINSIEDSIPIRTMTNIKTINVDIDGKILDGIRILIDSGYNNEYLVNLETINIRITDNSFIYYNDNFDKLITFINPKLLLKTLTVNIYENINETEKYIVATTINFDKKTIYKKIKKLTIEIDNEFNLDLDEFEEFIYIKDIIIISKGSNDIKIFNGNNLKQKINIIIYEIIN